MISRRAFIKTSATMSLAYSLNLKANESSNFVTKKFYFYMPEESEPHKRTWIPFVANDYIWGKTLSKGVKKDLLLIASTIAKYEPVNIVVSQEDQAELIKLLGSLDNHNFPITLVHKQLDDLWFRDTAPTFVYNEKNEKLGIDFNFNGWGDKQEHQLDKQTASFITKHEGLELLKSSLCLEGGCFEVDGEGIAIMTESCIINDNRNPNKTKQEIEEELKYLLGLKKIIWLKGIKGKDITDAHTDFYARFIRPGMIAVAYEPYTESYEHDLTLQNLEILKNATDLHGNPFELVVLDNPQYIDQTLDSKDLASGYIGYYVCNGAIIMQAFGDKYADKKAKKILEKAYPNRRIEQLRVDYLAMGGGTIHCSTQQEPIDL